MIVADAKMLIKTALGTLVAYASDDDERPGIFVDLRRPGLGVDDAPLLAIECDMGEDGPFLRTFVWSNVNDDSPRIIEHTGISEFFKMIPDAGEPEEYNEGDY